MNKKSKHLQIIDKASSQYAVAISRLRPDDRERALALLRGVVESSLMVRGDLDEASIMKISERVVQTCEIRSDLAACDAGGRA